MQFPEQRVLGRLVPLYAALRELPAATIAARAQKHFLLAAQQDDADVGAKTLGVDIVAHRSVSAGLN